jgi:phosphate-selective porin OprO/OprP
MAARGLDYPSVVPVAQRTKTKPSMRSIHRSLLVGSFLGCLAAHAGNETTTSEPSDASTATGLLLGKLSGNDPWDRVWSAFTLYKDEQNPVLQEFALQGRYQAQWAAGESSTEDFEQAGKGEFIGDEIESRRARLGFKSKWFQNWKFEGQIDVDADFENDAGESEFYRDIYDLYLSYAPSNAFNVSVGKTKAKFTREQEISSKEILTIERSGLSNTLFPGELTGVWVNGKGLGGHWLYELGVYGNDRQREFSEFNDGAIILGKIGYDYSKLAGFDAAVVSLQYMHNTDPGVQYASSTWSGSASPSFTDSIALTNDITEGRFGLVTDVVYAFGFEGTATQKGAPVAINQSDVFGVSVIPSYYLTDDLQLVGRVQVATANGPDGLKSPGRYDEASLLPSGGDAKGNSFISTYLGLNYYIYGHKLKLMSGLEYTHLGGGDYDGTTFYTGLRAYF